MSIPTSNRTFHFISGLPRAGSTLTAAHPAAEPALSRRHVEPGRHAVRRRDRARSRPGTELSTMVNEEQRARILRGLFDSYYADLEQPVIFDTNRAWTAKLPALMRLFPDAKVICCVRDVAWVMDSLERQFRNNAFEHTRLFNSRPNARPSIPASRRWRMPTAWSASPGTRCARPATRNMPSAC